jgi:proline dehydrogenase
MIKVDFRNTEIAFRHLNHARLFESYLVFKALGVSPLVKFSTTMIAKGLELGLPITPLVRHTIFRQFCGGVDAKSCMKLVKHMSQFGVGAILDYSVEALDREEDYDEVVKETLRCIELAKANPEILPMCVFKVTAIARFSLLEKLSTGEALSADEQAEYERVLARVQIMATACADAHIALLIDAEESWVQKALDDLALLMMKEFNRERCVVYNTLQMYRHDRLSYLEEMIALAKKDGFLFGAKFVRGAYMEKERARAKSLGIASPINKDKQSTDRMFDDSVAMALGEIEHVGVFIGTHNDASTAKAIALMAKLKIAPQDPRVMFSQLYGMSDNLSYNLAHAGYRVAKYLPYGPVKSVLPYLFRRAEENSSIKGQAGRELKLIRAEIKRRRKAC